MSKTFIYGVQQPGKLGIMLELFESGEILELMLEFCQLLGIFFWED